MGPLITSPIPYRSINQGVTRTNALMCGAMSSKHQSARRDDVGNSSGKTLPVLRTGLFALGGHKMGLPVKEPKEANLVAILVWPYNESWQ